MVKKNFCNFLLGREWKQHKAQQIQGF
jgi:hypothetical protein